MYEVIDDRLVKDGERVEFVRSPSISGSFQPKYLIIHCSEGTSLRGTVDWLSNPTRKSNASAHLVIGKKSEIVQLVDFATTAHHTGNSQIAGRKGVDRFCLGIELDNPGDLTTNPEGSGAKSQEKSTYWKKADRTYKSDFVIKAKHKMDGKDRGWHKYPIGQVCTALEISRVLISEFNLVDVLGHDEIAAKTDPGPAFDMLGFRFELFGRTDPLLDWWEELPPEVNI